MDKIVVISDSHGEHIFDKHIMFDVRHIGPRTAFKLSEHRDLVMKALDGTLGNKILFIFGEIDCRRHIMLKANMWNKNPLNLVDRTVEIYIGFVQDLIGIGYDIMVFNVVPPGEKTTGCQGTLEERTYITEYMNRQLHSACKNTGIVFIDIYNKLIDTNGLRKKDLIGDEAHLNSKVVKIFLDNFM